MHQETGNKRPEATKIYTHLLKKDIAYIRIFPDKIFSETFCRRLKI